MQWLPNMLFPPPQILRTAKAPTNRGIVDQPPAVYRRKPRSGQSFLAFRFWGRNVLFGGLAIKFVEDPAAQRAARINWSRETLQTPPHESLPWRPVGLFLLAGRGYALTSRVGHRMQGKSGSRGAACSRITRRCGCKRIYPVRTRFGWAPLSAGEPPPRIDVRRPHIAGPMECPRHEMSDPLRSNGPRPFKGIPEPEARRTWPAPLQTVLCLREGSGGDPIASARFARLADAVRREWRPAANAGSLASKELKFSCGAWSHGLSQGSRSRRGALLDTAQSLAVSWERSSASTFVLILTRGHPCRAWARIL